MEYTKKIRLKLSLTKEQSDDLGLPYEPKEKISNAHPNTAIPVPFLFQWMQRQGMPVSSLLFKTGTIFLRPVDVGIWEEEDPIA